MQKSKQNYHTQQQSILVIVAILTFLILVVNTLYNYLSDQFSLIEICLTVIFISIIIFLIYKIASHCSLIFKQRKKLKNLNPDEKIHLKKFCEKGCFSITKSHISFSSLSTAS